MNKNLEEKMIMYKLAMNFPTLKYEELEKIYWLIKGVSIAQENLKKENKNEKKKTNY